MDSSDRNKLIRAGFRIMRASKLNKTITEISCTGGWILVCRCQSVAGLHKAVKDLRVDEKVIFEMAE